MWDILIHTLFTNKCYINNYPFITNYKLQIYSPGGFTNTIPVSSNNDKGFEFKQVKCEQKTSYD